MQSLITCCRIERSGKLNISVRSQKKIAVPGTIGHVTLLGILKRLFKGTGSAANDIGSGMRRIGCKWGQKSAADPSNVPIIISDLLGNSKECLPTEGAEKSINSNKKGLFTRM